MQACVEVPVDQPFRLSALSVYQCSPSDWMSSAGHSWLALLRMFQSSRICDPVGGMPPIGRFVGAQHAVYCQQGFGVWVCVSIWFGETKRRGEIVC